MYEIRHNEYPVAAMISSRHATLCSAAGDTETPHCCGATHRHHTDDSLDGESYKGHLGPDDVPSMTSTRLSMLFDPLHAAAATSRRSRSSQCDTRAAPFPRALSSNLDLRHPVESGCTRAATRIINVTATVRGCYLSLLW